MSFATLLLFVFVFTVFYLSGAQGTPNSLNSTYKGSTPYCIVGSRESCSARSCSHAGPSRTSPAGASFLCCPTWPRLPFSTPGTPPGAALAPRDTAGSLGTGPPLRPPRRKRSSVGEDGPVLRGKAAHPWDTSSSPVPEQETPGDCPRREGHRRSSRNHLSSGSAGDRAQGQQGRLPRSRV